MTTLADQAYQILRNQVVTGKAPVGVRLSDRDLSRQLGMSRTPIRRAIERMQEEGLVEKHPHGGFRITQPSSDELMQIFELRQVVEGQAARYAAERITADQLAQLESINRQIGQIARGIRVMGITVLDGAVARRINRLDAEFHMTILRAANNPRLLQVIQQQKLFSRVFGFKQHDPHRNALRLVSRFIYLHHARILQAFKRQDPVAAEQAMRTHMEQAIEGYFRDIPLDNGMSKNGSTQDADWATNFLNQITAIESQTR